MSKTAVSKVIMAHKLHEVQKNLMGKKFERLSLDYILPLIFEECGKQNMAFWFNFLEDSCVLNLRDTVHENYELNIRYAYQCSPVSIEKVNEYKRVVLINTFLITSASRDVVSSAKKDEENIKHEDKPIQESNIVPPAAIRVAMEECEKLGEPVTRKNVELKLNLKAMSQEKKSQCIAYLRDMEV